MSHALCLPLVSHEQQQHLRYRTSAKTLEIADQEQFVHGLPYALQAVFTPYILLCPLPDCYTGSTADSPRPTDLPTPLKHSVEQQSDHKLACPFATCCPLAASTKPRMISRECLALFTWVFPLTTTQHRCQQQSRKPFSSVHLRWSYLTLERCAQTSSIWDRTVSVGSTSQPAKEHQGLEAR
jgi:hypothetical protein